MDVTANTLNATDGTVWHALPMDDVAKRLATSVDKGLAHLLRQDGHADADGDDGGVGGHG